MATIKLFLCILCIAALGSGRMFNGSLLRGNDPARLIAIAEAELGVREATGNNDGLRVEQYLATAGLKKGQPWCAAFISWVFKKAGFKEPRTGWSPALFPSNRLKKYPAAGNVFSIYMPELKRIAHCGLVCKADDKYIAGIEGNTNNSGSRNGDGVHKRVRHLKTIRSFADWINPAQKGGKS